MSDPLEDQVIGKYKVVELISKGGMATVYRAKDLILEREVAFKIIHSHLEDADSITQRFLLEAKLIAQLDHPNIVKVYDYFDYEGRAVLIIEFILGDTLSSLMKLPEAIPEEFVLMIASELLKGLRAAHQKGIIHRDIKPANILISAEKGIKISDFGLAKFQQSDSHLTQEGMFVGTPSFSSPEQIQGLPVDERSDLFSLGLTLFMLAKKAHAFRKKGDSQDTTIRRILDGDQNSQVADSAHRLSESLEAFLTRSIHVDPMARFQSCDEMLLAVENLMKKRDLIPYEKSLQAFLKNPQATIEEVLDSPTHIQDSLPSIVQRLRRKTGLKKVAAFILVVLGLCLGALSIEQSRTQKKFPEFTGALDASGFFRLYESDSGQKVYFLGLAPRSKNLWLLYFENVGSIFEGEALVHEFRQANVTRPSYVIDWGDRDYFSLVTESRSGSLDRLLMATPDGVDAGILKEREDSNGQEQNRQRSLQAFYALRPVLQEKFSRGLWIERSSLVLKQKTDEVNETCGSSYQTQVAWADLSDESLFHQEIETLCGRPLKVIQSICQKDEFKFGLIFDFEELICGFGSENRVEVRSKKLIWQINLKNPASIADFYNFLHERHQP